MTKSSTWSKTLLIGNYIRPTTTPKRIIMNIVNAGIVSLLVIGFSSVAHAQTYNISRILNVAPPQASLADIGAGGGGISVYSGAILNETAVIDPVNLTIRQ